MSPGARSSESQPPATYEYNNVAFRPYFETWVFETFKIPSSAQVVVFRIFLRSQSPPLYGDVCAGTAPENRSRRRKTLRRQRNHSSEQTNTAETAFQIVSPILVQYLVMRESAAQTIPSSLAAERFHHHTSTVYNGRPPSASA